VGCSSCARPDEDYVWTDREWRLIPFPEPGGLPVVLLLEPRQHFAGLFLTALKEEGAHSGGRARQLALLAGASSRERGRA
jgi:hypothetical protein